MRRSLTVGSKWATDPASHEAAFPLAASSAAELCNRKSLRRTVALYQYRRSSDNSRRRPARQTGVAASLTRHKHDCHTPQNVAIGFSAEPVAPGTASGAAVMRKSQRCRRFASLLINSRSQLSKMGIPMATNTSV